MPNKTESYEDDINITPKRPRCGARHVQVVFIFVCLTISMAMRANFSVAIVAMTDNSTSSNPNIPTYEWKHTSVMLSAFFWSYIILQIPTGYLSKIYGFKYFVFGCTLANTIAFTFIPLSAKVFGSKGVIAMRVIQGLGQGALFPCAHTMMGNWVPVQERSTMGMLIYSGISCGSILSFMITGYVCSSSLGWPFSFYIFATCGYIWCLLFVIFGHNSPAVHPSITYEERRYIEKSLRHTGNEPDTSVPWKSILTCIHFWAIVAANIGSAWGYTMMMTEIPTYLGKVMKFKISSNGVMSAIPYIASAISGLIFAPLSDYLTRNDILSTIHTRRTFQLCGSYELVVCLLLLAYVIKTQVLAVVLLSLGNIGYASTLVGYSVNHVDLSPKFAGVLHGISNAISQTIAMFSPLVVDFIVQKQENVEEWRLVFIIAAAFYFICATIFGCFSSATQQIWDGAVSLESIDSRMAIRRRTRSTLFSLTGL